MIIKTADFDYALPPELIAQTPAQPRDSSRLLVYNRAGAGVEHRRFYDVLDYLNPGDALVLNETRVLPARLIGERADTGGRLEFLLLRQVEPGVWEGLSRPARRAQTGRVFTFGGGVLQGEVVRAGEDGLRHMRFACEGDFETALNAVGSMPLPPYIHTRLMDSERYQTVYAQTPGSAAAPTAGLHFTPQLLQRAGEKGVRLVYVLLHVGLGTFRPVQAEDAASHKMHSEYFELTPAAAQTLNAARAAGGRVIAVGTTSTRVLETLADEEGRFAPGSGWTDIFIYPGYKFKGIDGQITNFHLPRSTLLMMISAFAGREEVLRLYQTAVERQYRFFSFGDAMLLL